MRRFLFALLAAVLFGTFPAAAQECADPLQGKAIGVIGDSYVRNHKEPFENTWHYKFAMKHGMKYHNYGRNGNCIALDLKQWGIGMYQRYKEMTDSLDYVLVIAGHNDASRLDSIGIDLFKERLEILCNGLVEKYPEAQILFFTPWNCENFIGSNREKVVDAMIEVCGSHGIPVFDSARNSGIHVESDRFRSIYFQGRGVRDTAHLNAKGHDRFLPTAEAFILQHTATAASAQTGRKVTVNLTADGAANMQVFIPEKPSGRAIVGCPGGGYSHLSMQNEGTDWVDFFNSRGITYGVLTYRMPKGDRTIPMSDAENAIRTMRDSAAVWGINPYDVGIMGFSAGGHLASTTATHAPLDAMPNFQILFYPVISMDEKLTHKGSVVGFLGDGRGDEKLVKEFSSDRSVKRHLTPPAIILMASDDRAVPPLTNGLPYYTALRKAGIPATMHIYPSGGHGFGFRNTFAYHELMKEELSTWLSHLNTPNADAKRVACIGNSITDGHGIDMVEVQGYPARLQQKLGNGYCVRNFGVSGRTMLNNGNRPYMKERAWQNAKQFNPDIVVIKLGTNDSKPMNWDTHSKEFATDMQQMIDELNALPSKPVIYLCNPIKAKHETESGDQNQIRDEIITSEIIPIINKVAKKNKLTVIDLNPVIDPTSDLMQRDGIYPTEKGTAKIAETVAEAILAASGK